MTKEEVFKSLEICISFGDCNGCSYIKLETDSPKCIKNLMKDSYSLLKEYMEKEKGEEK